MMVLGFWVDMEVEMKTKGWWYSLVCCNPYVGSHVFGRLMDKPPEGEENERISDKGCFFRVHVLDFLFYSCLAR